MESLFLFLVFWNAESATSVNSTSIGQNVTAETIYSPSLHDLQVYGVVVTILLCFIVFGGVKIINRVAPAFLIPVLFSLFCIFIGIFAAPRRGAPGELGLSQYINIYIYIYNRHVLLFVCS